MFFYPFKINTAFIYWFILSYPKQANTKFINFFTFILDNNIDQISAILIFRITLKCAILYDFINKFFFTGFHFIRFFFALKTISFQP